MSSASFSVTLHSRPRRYRCGPSWSLDLRVPDYDLWFVHGGRAYLDRGGRSVEISEGCGLVFFPGERVTGYQDPKSPLDVTGIHFGASICALLRPLGETVVENDADRKLIETWLTQMGAAAASERHWKPICEHLLSCILMKMLQTRTNDETPSHSQEVKALAAEIRAHPEMVWTIERMCRETGVCRTVLHQSFQAAMGMSPGGFVILSRIDSAEALLLDTNLSIKEIARATGYNDIYFFSRQFKKCRGQSPAAYRRTRRGGV